MAGNFVIAIGLILSCFTFSSSHAQEAEASELTQAFKSRALAAMKHSDQRKRKSAYRTFQHLGKKSLKDYIELLREAQRYHQASMRNTMRVRSNPYIELALESETLASERGRVMELIHTDWKKDPGKIRMLQNEMEKLSRKYKRVLKLARANTESIDAKMGTAFLALTEIQWELASIERQSDNENTSDVPDNRELEDLVIEDIFEAEEWKQKLDQKKKALAEAQRLEDAEKHNAGCKWANGSQKNFSDHLNGQRAVIGLGPLLLEERLSFASQDHSNDMKTLGFFSHTSPVPGKRSPADRARKAKFRGSWTGENIFMGSPSPMAAYNGWFGSDGHRFIMFTRGGSNVIGVGVVGGHWTMMTGRQ